MVTIHILIFYMLHHGGADGGASPYHVQNDIHFQKSSFFSLKMDYMQMERPPQRPPMYAKSRPPTRPPVLTPPIRPPMNAPLVALKMCFFPKSK